VLQSCSILTVPAAPQIVGLHDRQPLVLEPAQWQAWLHATPGEAAELLQTPQIVWTFHRVSRAVNNARNEGPGLLERVAE
jgi:putative SOS response-associated peptidase YedK